jgi:hypothetical protein
MLIAIDCLLSIKSEGAEGKVQLYNEAAAVEVQICSSGGRWTVWKTSKKLLG